MVQLRSDAMVRPLFVNRVVSRVKQFLLAMFHRQSQDVDRELAAYVENEDQWSMLARLTPFDRAHHLEVVRALITAGHEDADLLLAAALHDVGKADELGRVGISHRVAKVLLGAYSEDVLTNAARHQSRFGHGLYLAVHHADIGAVLVRQTGANERCCWLIAHHHDRLAEVDDSDLAALILADEGAYA